MFEILFMKIYKNWKLKLEIDLIQVKLIKIVKRVKQGNLFELKMKNARQLLQLMFLNSSK